MYPVKNLKDGPVIKCNCEIYKFLQNSLFEEDKENSELDPKTSCMHCRFFNEHLMDAYAKIISSNSNLPRPLEMVQKFTWYNEVYQILLVGRTSKKWLN